MGIKEMILEGLVSITPKQQNECVDHVKQVEKDYWKTNNGMDEITEPVVFTLTESDEDTDVADEFKDDI